MFYYLRLVVSPLPIFRTRFLRLDLPRRRTSRIMQFGDKQKNQRIARASPKIRHFLSMDRRDNLCFDSRQRISQNRSAMGNGYLHADANCHTVVRPCHHPHPSSLVLGPMGVLPLHLLVRAIDDRGRENKPLDEMAIAKPSRRKRTMRGMSALRRSLPHEPERIGYG